MWFYDFEADFSVSLKNLDKNKSNFKNVALLMTNK